MNNTVYKVHFTTLGCSKNDIDTEVMISLLDTEQYILVDDIHDADISIINTCSFILDAKKQSIEAIFEIAQLKKTTLKYLIIAGCLAQRYPRELKDDIPEIDTILGTGQVGFINQILRETTYNGGGVFVSGVNNPHNETAKRVDFSKTQYVKISEGCNNHCTYCIIPKLRGRMRSRKIEHILDEVRFLVSRGTREIILIAQNTTEYGKDIYGEPSLHKLLDTLDQIPDVKWIRVLYMYPEGFYDELIETFAHAKKLIPYVDMPLQHVSDSVLETMGRKSTKKSIIDLIEQLRNALPNIIIRSTFIVGFASETEKDFQELLDFLSVYKLDRVGVFCYSLEEGTRAYKWGSPVDEMIKEQRKADLMELQAKISFDKLERRVGTKMECLIEEKVEDGLYVGRSYMDAPGIDGQVYVHSKNDLTIGEFYDIMVLSHDDYDLVAEKV
ncbi:MAG: 30S ribosomal protein S12 methylthiotransferase RimO [Tissierellia bacterium]|nr:30S ribosomal protein S12 methylthiotransferase RimO [Tissierellia bacterium]